MSHPSGRRPNQLKGPVEWVTGHEPMTGAQPSYLRTLSEEAHDPAQHFPGCDRQDVAVAKGREVHQSEIEGAHMRWGHAEQAV